MRANDCRHAFGVRYLNMSRGRQYIQFDDALTIISSRNSVTGAASFGRAGISACGHLDRAGKVLMTRRGISKLVAHMQSDGARSADKIVCGARVGGRRPRFAGIQATGDT